MRAKGRLSDYQRQQQARRKINETLKSFDTTAAEMSKRGRLREDRREHAWRLRDEQTRLVEQVAALADREGDILDGLTDLSQQLLALDAALIQCFEAPQQEAGKYVN
jgi:adenosyl cobinamide kinase/adenosyl cobinamide phosphate guanylyltransferase